MPSIIVVAGPNEGDYYPLGTRTIVVGRQEGCPVQVVDDRVSRKHIQIRFEPEQGAAGGEAAGSYHLLDMKSQNGTFVNGRKIDSEVVLQDEDEIEIGGSRIVFSTTAFPDRSSAFDHFRRRGERGRPTIGP
jgi:pSer/pThr/pTyr-binding forkhead associated (FHA) protein